MSYGIHTSVDPMQPPCGDPSLDPGLAEVSAEQLLERHDSVLLRRDLGNKFVGGCELESDTDYKSHREPRAPPPLA
jgi:hypothetical protein